MKRIKKVIFIIGFIFIISIALHIMKTYENKKAIKELQDMGLYTGVNVKDEKEYKKWLKTEPSDIKGMTQYDKLKMGLNNHDGSDTDEDGLTDKEEIEIYGSDPLKPSTSGDLYLDSYKIEHNLDINTYYEYKDDINFDYNECQEIELIPSQISDFNTVAQDITGTENITGFQIFKEYYVYNYSNKITIDLKNVLDENDLSINDIDVLINNETSIKRAKYSTNEEKISFKKNLSNQLEYKIYIVNKNKWSSFILWKNGLNLLQTTTSETKGVALVYGSQFLSLFR